MMTDGIMDTAGLMADFARIDMPGEIPELLT